MKYIIRNFSFFLLLTLMFTACDKSELMTYEDQDNIYFTKTVVATPGDGRRDSIMISFPYYRVGLSDTTISVDVKIMGKPANRDRQFNLVVDTGTTAIEGKHFDLVKPFVIPADSIGGKVKIKIKRTLDLTTEGVILRLALQPNEDFATNMQYIVTNTTTGAQMSTEKFRILINDILMPPKYFVNSSPYYGAYTKKKCLFICELCGTTPSYFNTDYPENSLLLYFATFTQRYLNEQAAIGNIILDEDGTPMKMGPSVN